MKPGDFLPVQVMPVTDVTGKLEVCVGLTGPSRTLSVLPVKQAYEQACFSWILSLTARSYLGSKSRHFFLVRPGRVRLKKSQKCLSKLSREAA